MKRGKSWAISRGQWKARPLHPVHLGNQFPSLQRISGPSATWQLPGPGWEGRRPGSSRDSRAWGGAEARLTPWDRFPALRARLLSCPARNPPGSPAASRESLPRWTHRAPLPWMPVWWDMAAAVGSRVRRWLQRAAPAGDSRKWRLHRRPSASSVCDRRPPRPPVRPAASHRAPANAPPASVLVGGLQFHGPGSLPSPPAAASPTHLGATPGSPLDGCASSNPADPPIHWFSEGMLKNGMKISLNLHFQLKLMCTVSSLVNSSWNLYELMWKVASRPIF